MGAAKASGASSREVEVLAAALRGDGSVDPAKVAIAAMKLANCGVTQSAPIPEPQSPAEAPKAEVEQTRSKAIEKKPAPPSVVAPPSESLSRLSTPELNERKELAKKELATAKADKDV